MNEDSGFINGSLNQLKLAFSANNIPERFVGHQDDGILDLQKDTIYSNIGSYNKVDIRVGDNQRQRWILQDKFSQKTPSQSSHSFEMESLSVSQLKNQRQDDIGNEQSTIIGHPAEVNQRSILKSSNDSYKNDALQFITEKNKHIDINTPLNTSQKIRKGRTMMYRQKQESCGSSIDKKKKSKKLDDQNTSDFQSEQEIGIKKNELGEEEGQQNAKRKSKIWVSSFYHIILFVNRFLYRNKLKLVYFHPQQLQNNQMNAINDIAYQYNNEFENKQIVRDNIFRSRFKIVRKLRITYLILRKKTKLCIQPLIVLQNKFTAVLRKVLDPIPVILPYHNISLLWELLVVFLILVNVIKIPYEIAFDNGSVTVGIVAMISKIIFFLDIFMMFNTAYYENGVLEKQRSKIFIHFIKHRLTIEILAYLCLWINPFGVPTFRIFFLIKFFQFYETIEKLAEAFQLSYKYSFIVNLIALLIEVILLCHLFACIWYSIGYYQQQNSLYPNWIQKFSETNEPQFSQYIDSIYFSVITIGTIGYGDIVAVSTIEKACITIMAIFSCGIFAYILSNIQNVYRDYQVKQEGYLNKLAELNNYMFNREVNPTLQQMARKYLKYVHEQGYQQGVMPCETLNSLSASLREEIKEDIFKKSVNGIKFLSAFSQQLRSQLSRKMKEVNYGPDEFVMKSGSISPPCLYYILKGQVEVCLDKGIQFGSQQLNQNGSDTNLPFYVQKSNDLLGLFEFSTQSQVSMTNARSIGVTTVHVLSLEDFSELLNQSSIDRELYCQQKDKLIFQKNYESINLYCYSCKSSQHLIKDCPIFFYRPNQQKVINTFNREQKDKKKVDLRSDSANRYHTLAIRNDVEKDVLKFCDENESQIESLYESQSSVDDLQNSHESQIYSKQISNLSPHKPKSEVNLRQLRSLYPTNDECQLQDEELVKIQPEKMTHSNIKNESYDYLDKEDQLFFGDQKGSSQMDLKALEKIQQQERQINSKIEVKGSDLTDRRKSQKNIQKLASKNSQNIQNQTRSSQLQLQRLSIQLLEKNLNILNTKTQNEMSAYIKQPTTKIQKNNPTSSHSLLSQSKTLKKRSSMHMSQIQNMLNLISTLNKHEIMNQDEMSEDLITETMRIFKYYMPQNNANIVIKQYNAYQFKQQRYSKQKLIEVASQSIPISKKSVFLKNFNQSYQSKVQDEIHEVPEN